MQQRPGRSQLLTALKAIALTAIPNYQAEMTIPTMLRLQVTLPIMKEMNDS
jgi:hypothetical protein